MTSITASMVKELRERTGLGMMDCKKALSEASGDMEKAIEDLRKASGLKAAKKASRVAAEGVVMAKVSGDGNRGVILEVNSETDFVAKNSSFIELANSILMIALKHECADLDSIKSLDLDGSMSVHDKLVEQTGVIGEKLAISAFERVEANYVGSYTHGVKIAVLIGLNN